MSVASVGIISAPPMPIPADFSGQAVKHIDAAVQPEKSIKPQGFHSTTADLQRIGTAFNRKLQFIVDHNSNEVIVKVIDKETDKVIREIPPEELQRLYRNLKEAIGLLFDDMI